ncbi:unnamed protein product [Pleuronectes platessa]|uniref:Uncharacterized protein n=1 Tax=Pleuronectes platessa TaxID=8262 RepID=A0A9N7TT15_PLEPL|nr:unnamed protein product [Pleuronectes platessa]
MVAAGFIHHCVSEDLHHLGEAVSLGPGSRCSAGTRCEGDNLTDVTRGVVAVSPRNRKEEKWSVELKRFQREATQTKDDFIRTDGACAAWRRLREPPSRVRQTPASTFLRSPPSSSSSLFLPPLLRGVKMASFQTWFPIETFKINAFSPDLLDSMAGTAYTYCYCYYGYK